MQKCLSLWTPDLCVEAEFDDGSLGMTLARGDVTWAVAPAAEK